MVSDDTRKREDEWITKGVKPDKPTTDTEQALLDQSGPSQNPPNATHFIFNSYLLLRRGDIRGS